MVLENMVRDGFSEEMTYKGHLKGEKRVGQTWFWPWETVHTKAVWQDSALGQ